ncbi:formate/nitrite transporter family protein [Xylanibacter brevis]|uniref:formate/nitrite transporter family protein n=2 Tax=Xylanibacter brevis TaxID=83231 RepID=UPI0009DFC82B|nr:formate/nitrite transporter family protein [Xylanibacter brevis]
MNQPLSILRSAFLAGLCISIGCVVNLRVGGVAGAVLFSFGLLAVLHYQLKLYTGTAGFVRAKGDWGMLAQVLIGNVLACSLCSMVFAYAQPDILPAAETIVLSRLSKGPLACFLLAIGCGFIMTTAVQFGRGGKFLPLLFGVPVFILCGFTHSIADAFYFMATPQFIDGNLLTIYIGEVLGNFVGCNLYRWVISPENQVQGA